MDKRKSWLMCSVLICKNVDLQHDSSLFICLGWNLMPCRQFLTLVQCVVQLPRLSSYFMFSTISTKNWRNRIMKSKSIYWHMNWHAMPKGLWENYKKNRNLAQTTKCNLQRVMSHTWKMFSNSTPTNLMTYVQECGNKYVVGLWADF